MYGYIIIANAAYDGMPGILDEMHMKAFLTLPN